MNLLREILVTRNNVKAGQRDRFVEEDLAPECVTERSLHFIKKPLEVPVQHPVVPKGLALVGFIIAL